MTNTAVLEKPTKRPPPASTVKSDDHKRWWTSDLHIGHVNILDYCPGRKVLGNDPAEFSEALVKRWNETVGPDDDVMILGDLCMGKIDESLAVVPRLNGHKKLIPGNHDRCWAFAKNKTPEKRKEWEQKYRDAGLELWPEQVCVPVGKYTVLLCHFPYRGDSQDQDRYLFARPTDEGRVLVCGHVHDTWAEMDKMINVGLDVRGYKPIDDAELIRLIEKVTNGS